MRATGLSYASQQFEVDGCSIKVRIEPGQEYITLSGGVNIISGVTRDGEVIELSPAEKTLRSYKPTQNAWDVPLHKDPTKSPGAFSDEPLLSKAGTQYAALRPTMFSGRMVQAVQILMGRGIEVKYDFRWAKCHGVTTGPDDKHWLIEISSNGVRAMRFKLASGNKASKNEAVKQATLMFGGVPTGTTFPTGTKLDEAIDAGSVKVLRAASRMTDFYEKRDYATTMGWSFNDEGTEAHNTCWQAVTPGLETPDLESADTVFTSYHYKLLINFFTNGDPPVAELELVASGRLTKKQYLGSGPYQPIPLYIYDFMAGVERPLWQQQIPATEPDVAGVTPLIACHVNGVLEVVNVTVRTAGDYNYATTLNPSLSAFTISITAHSAGRVLTYPSYDPARDDYTLSSLSTATPFVSGGDSEERYVGFMTSTVSRSNASGPGGTGMWGAYARDAFVVFRPEAVVVTGTGATAFSVTEANPTEVKNAFDRSEIISDVDGVQEGFDYINVPGQIAVLSRSVTTAERPVAFHISTGPEFVVEDDSELRSLPWMYLTYSAFGSSEQQVSVTADGYHYTLGGLLASESATAPRKEFTFIGYT